jgi:hypothetical protein
MIYPPSQETEIMRLQVRGSGLDPLTAQQRLASTLNALSLRPTSLTPSAILCIRTFRDPRPGSLRLRQPDAGATRAWEQAVNHALDQLVRQAAHPIDGVVPANARAVIFADRSELLACLAADWCAGTVRSQWWWQSLLHGGDITRAVIGAWLETPEYIPLTLHRLLAHQQAISFVQQLSDVHTHSLLNAVVQTFGLYELSTVLSEVLDHQPEGRDVIEQHTGNTTSTRPVQVMPIAPWQSWIQTRSSAHLPTDRQMLLGVGLMLHEAPTIVRRAAFAHEVLAWHVASRGALLQQRAPTEIAPTHALSSAGTAEAEAARQTETTVDIHSASSEDLTEPTVPPSLRGGRRPAKQSPSRQPDMPTDNELASHPSTSPRKDAAPFRTLTPTEVEPLQADIETEFGGACYFINLGLFLNLYGDFTTPLQPGLDLPIWDFVALVAQELIGEEVTRDPIWSLLAQLADRAEDEPPGTHFDPANNVIVSPAGAKQSPSPSNKIPSSRTVLTRPALFSGVAMTPLDIWFNDLMSIIRPRLQLALGVSTDELPRYFKQRARLVVSAVNFDAYFALADLPIEIRLSGLDRDPGWVPAAGRTVRFHYD